MTWATNVFVAQERHGPQKIKLWPKLDICDDLFVAEDNAWAAKQKIDAQW